MAEDDLQTPVDRNSRDSVTTDHISVRQAVELLRADVPVRDDWRDMLLRDVSNAPRPERTPSAEFLPDVPGRVLVFRRRLSVRPVVAIAACLLAMIIGSAGTMAVMNTKKTSSPGVTTASEAALPLVRAANVNDGTDQRQIIRFVLVAPGAANVSVVGDFNNWNPNATPLKTARDGSTWLIDMPLSAGRHVYAFMVDGDIVADPSAARVTDHDFGVQNSVILVGSL